MEWQQENHPDSLISAKLLKDAPLFMDCKACRKHFQNCGVEESLENEADSHSRKDPGVICKERWIEMAGENIKEQ